MPGILIIAHAPLASALKSVVMHAYADCSCRVEALDVGPESSLEAVDAQARALLQQVRNPEAIIFTDVFGATPCNVAQRLGDSPHVRVIAGVNVPMLWRCLCYENESLDAMVSRAISGATQGVIQVAAAHPQIQALEPGDDDQEDPHHHQ